VKLDVNLQFSCKHDMQLVWAYCCSALLLLSQSSRLCAPPTSASSKAGSTPTVISISAISVKAMGAGPLD
jgi:hypothetical protein